jgi:formate hydrogenlyase subunit 3/multisubunit Na+/H+ antiporter MnhD subunit
MALTVTAAGGLALFAGVLVLGHIAGSYDLDTVLASGDRVRGHPLYLTALLLVLLGAFTKSAQFPFHFWLPHAMAAPTPVSAYLHSATLVKAGVFLLVRLWPVLAGTDAWFWTVGSAGLVTLLLGAYAAIFQNDLKGLLAYSTISHLGLITLLLGLNSDLALVAAVFHVLNHAAFKASLFMAAGIIDHETGTRDIRRLSGLNRSMPFTARLALVAAAAMAGVPLLNGFISKEMFFAEALTAQAALPLAAMLASAFSVTYSLRFIHGAFFGPDPGGPAARAARAAVLDRHHPPVHDRRDRVDGGPPAGPPAALDGRRAAARRRHRARRLAVRPPVPDLLLRVPGPAGRGEVPTASALLFDVGVFALVVGATVLVLIALAHQSVRGRRAAAPRAEARLSRPPRRGSPPRWGRLMELVVALAIGVLTGSGVWLLLRSRTFQVVIGLSLLSYAVNLFIFSTGGLRSGAAPILERGAGGRPGHARRPRAAGAGADRHRDRLRDHGAVPGGAARGPRPDGDRPRGRPGGRALSGGWTDHLVVAPIVVPLLAGALMVLAGDGRRKLNAALGLASTAALVVLALALLRLADAADPGATAPRRRCASTGWATGRRCSPSCWCWTAFPR